jgi:hypothetical protein
MNDKGKKILLGVGVGVVALSLVYYNRDILKNKISSALGVFNIGGSSIKEKPKNEIAQKKCSGGEIPCPNDPNKCYNPTITYFQNPCSAFL